MTDCLRCGEKVPPKGRGKPPAMHDDCKREVVRDYDETEFRTCCAVCGEHMWTGLGRRTHAVTCSSRCRTHLSRILRDTSLL